MGRPFRLASERRQIARPSYGGEREPDSHPTPGPPTLVQSARVQLPWSAGRAPRNSPGVVRSPGRFSRAARRLPVETDVSDGVWISSAVAAASPAPSAPWSRRRSRPTPASCTPPSATPGTTTSRCPGPRSPRTTAPSPTRSCSGPRSPAAGTTWPRTSQPPLWDDAPSRGPPARSASPPGWPPSSRRHTATPEDCWFGAGTARVRRGRSRRACPDCCLRGGHDVVLVRGAVADAVRNLAPEPHEQSANLWWPADRAWCVVTDIDLMSTYVGGSARVHRRPARGAPGWRSCPPRPATARRLAADTVNPLPEDASATGSPARAARARRRGRRGRASPVTARPCARP